MKKSSSKLDAAEVERRRQAFAQARASCALEGIYFDDEMLADVKLLINGEMTTEEFGKFIARKYANQTA